MGIKAIADRLKRLRQAVGPATQKKFAERCGISPSAYNNYERGLRRISLDEAMKIRRVTSVSLDWIYEGDPSGLPLHLADKLEERAPAMTSDQKSAS